MKKHQIQKAAVSSSYFSAFAWRQLFELNIVGPEADIYGSAHE